MNPQPLISPIALLQNTWSFFIKNWKVLGSILLPPFLCGIVSVLITGLVGTGLIHSNIAVIITFLVGLIFEIGFFVLVIVAYPAFVNAIHRLSTENNASLTVKGQFKYGFGLFWQFLLLMIITGLVSYGSAALFIIPGIAVIIYTGFNIFTFVIDGKKGFSALIESYDLVKGHWWQVFGRGLFLVLVGIVCFFVFGIVIAIIGSITTGILGSVVGGTIAFVLGATILISTEIILFSFGIIYMYNLYVALKALRSTQTTVNSSIKPWLIAFLIIGIVVVIGYIAMFTIAFSSDSLHGGYPANYDTSEMYQSNTN